MSDIQNEFYLDAPALWQLFVFIIMGIGLHNQHQEHKQLTLIDNLTKHSTVERMKIKLMR